MTTLSGISPSPATRSSIYQAMFTGAKGSQAQLAVRQASNSGLIAGLGVHDDKLKTYNAAGLLSLLSQTTRGYKAVPPSTVPTPVPATGPTSANGNTSATNNWVRLLQARPSMAFTATTYLLNQGIVANL